MGARAAEADRVVRDLCGKNIAMLSESPLHGGQLSGTQFPVAEIGLNWHAWRKPMRRFSAKQAHRDGV